MGAYASVSVGDPGIEGCWRTLAAAQSHVNVVENLLRSNALANNTFSERIADCERNVRTEWMRLGQQQPNALLSEIITIVGQNHNLWPSISEFKSYRETTRDNRKGKGGKGAQQDGGKGKGGYEDIRMTLFFLSKRFRK